VTTYFRKTFEVADPSTVASLSATLQIDDGCVAYLNGHELFRDGMADGVFTATTVANRSVSGTDENDFDPVTITTDKTAFLQAGTNVLAVEVHQAAVNSSDITLDINLNASTASTANNYSNDLFEIAGTELRLKNGSAGLLPGDYQVRVKALDHEGVSFTKVLTVQRINAAYTAAPLDITLAPASVVENTPAGTLAGTLTSQDADFGQAQRFELVAGAGDTDNARVFLAGGRVFLAESPDYEVRHSLNIRVKVTDSTGLSFTKALTIAITNLTTEDQDGDGLTELEEDLNGDGILDAGETSPLLADTDNDGFSDRVEKEAGSDPRNAASIPSVVELKQLVSHVTGDSWLTAVSWEGNQVPGPATMAVSDNLTFRSPPTDNPVFPGIAVDLRNGAIFRMKHTGQCSIGRIILKNATLQQGMTTAIGLGGGGAILEVPETISTGPDGIIDTAAVPLDLKASLSGAGTIKVTGTATGSLRLLSPAASFTGELSLEAPEVILADPAAAQGAHKINVKAGILRANSNVTLTGTALEISGTGKLGLAHTFGVSSAVLSGVTIPNGSHTGAALLALGVPASAIEDGGGTLVVGSTSPNGDSDGDGVSDAMETLAQTDPHDAADFLHLASVTSAGAGAFHLQWTAVPGVTYTVQYATDTEGVWQDITVVSPATAAGSYDMTVPSPLPARAFFRLAVKPN
jgi:hypothetical protein